MRAGLTVSSFRVQARARTLRMSTLTRLVIALSVVSFVGLGSACAEQKGRKKDDKKAEKKDDKKADAESKDAKPADKK